MIGKRQKCTGVSNGRPNKGLMSAAVFFIAISILFIVHLFLINNIRLRNLTSGTLISDRIYYLYNSIESSVNKIIEETFGNVTGVLVMNVTIDEQPDCSYVEFTEKFPQNASSFNKKLGAYKGFVENYLNDTNIDTDAGIGTIGGKMELEIEPYGILYTHTEPWGNGDKREYEVKPGDDPNAMDNLNGYDLTVQLTGGWEIMPDTEKWEPKKAGDLKFNTTIISYDGDPTFNVLEYLSRTQKSTFYINANLTNASGYFVGWVRALVSDTCNACLLFEMHLVEALVTTELNLTDIPGETKVDLPDGKINVIENLYYIEKNGTVNI